MAVRRKKEPMKVLRVLPTLPNGDAEWQGGWDKMVWHGMGADRTSSPSQRTSSSMNQSINSMSFNSGHSHRPHSQELHMSRGRKFNLYLHVSCLTTYG
jgi:hypothetical protein